MYIGIIAQILIMTVESDGSFLKAVLEGPNETGSSTPEDCLTVEVQQKSPAAAKLNPSCSERERASSRACFKEVLCLQKLLSSWLSTA